MKTVATALGLGAVLLASASHASTIAYWRFESDPPVVPGFGPDFLEDSGPNNLDLTNPGDLAGQSGVATSFSDPIPATGASNDYHAFTLNANQRLTLADNPLLPTDDFTIEAMVQFGGQVVNQNQNADIASQWGGGPNNAWRLLKNTNNQLSLGLSGSGFGFFVAPGFSFAALTDYYVAASVDVEADDTTSVTFYVQNLTAGGPLQVFPNVTTGAANPPGPLNDSTSDFVIGGNALTNDLAATRIDEVRLSSGALAQSDLLIVPEPSALAIAFVGALCGFMSRER